MANSTHALINLLQGRLKKQLNDNSIIINELEKSTGIYGIIHCQGLKHSLDEENNHKVGLFPLRIANLADYWLSIVVSLNTSTKNIKHVSISFYDDSVYKLFRAEWANNESVISHAQPHWHIHSQKQDSTLKSWDPEEVSSLFEKQIIQDDKIKNMHFSMCSTWHKKDGKHVEILSSITDNEILNWIQGVLTYITEQLTYIHDKRKIK